VDVLGAGRGLRCLRPGSAFVPTRDLRAVVSALSQCRVRLITGTTQDDPPSGFAPGNTPGESPDLTSRHAGCGEAKAVRKGLSLGCCLVPSTRPAGTSRPAGALVDLTQPDHPRASTSRKRAAKCRKGSLSVEWASDEKRRAGTSKCGRRFSTHPRHPLPQDRRPEAASRACRRAPCAAPRPSQRFRRQQSSRVRHGARLGSYGLTLSTAWRRRHHLRGHSIERETAQRLVAERR
jgi:hypothetical protein